MIILSGVRALVRRRLLVACYGMSALTLACREDHRETHPLAPNGRPPTTIDAGDVGDDGSRNPEDIGAGHVDSPPLPPLTDRGAVYDPADEGPIDLSVTVRDQSAFAAVEAGAPDVAAPIRFAATDYAAGDAGAGTNATIELHGSTSRSAVQKSYQIKLWAEAAPWRGTRTINLLKHPFDLTRVRNALSFAYFRRIASFASLRTGFVHLRVDGADRGLYEWVEEPDQTFLAAHGFDPAGALYKSKTFAFAPIDAASAADPAKVEDIVATKGAPDLAKLRRMAAAVNDVNQPIDDVLAHYFNRANYVTWLAVNLLTADFDSLNQNFLLYSPRGFEGWYLLPWDYDSAWGWNEQPGEPQRARWRQGVANWWSVILHRRFLAEPDNVAELEARVAELAATINDDATAAMLARTHDLIAAFVAAPPDLDNLPCDQQGTPAAAAAWETEYARIAGNAGRARAELAATIDRPMPFWLNLPTLSTSPAPGTVSFTWAPSYQLHGQAIRYDIEINARDTFDAASVLMTANDLTQPSFTTTALPSGHAFWRVVARATGGPADAWQVSFNDHLFVDVP